MTENEAQSKMNRWATDLVAEFAAEFPDAPLAAITNGLHDAISEAPGVVEEARSKGVAEWLV
ncbi:MAG: hypothetical protein CML68_13685 [Rhodobacteraceae bacterium]|nr:hypothetical protein [Paracoccaceae bacterium]